MKTRTGALVAAAVIAWALKQHYAAARADDLWWILAPTTTLVGVITGVPFTWQPGEGFISRERLFLIEKSCAGVNFLIAAFGMLMFTRRHRISGVVSAARVVGVSLLASYAAAVTANAVRIAIAIGLAAHPATLTALSAAAIHRIEGITVYFGGLLLLYSLARHVDHRARRSSTLSGTACAHVARAFRGAAVPLTAYYAVTLGVPLANGAPWSSDRFMEHALVVLIVPPTGIALACAVRAVLGATPRRASCVAGGGVPVRSGARPETRS